MEGFYKRTTICGTPIYLAPEIINNTGHDEKIDIWCIGVLMFELLTGLPPWKGDDITTLKYNISRLKINWQKNMDPDAVDLISKILRYIPEERITLRGMLMHPFFTKYFPDAVNSLKRPDNTKYKVYVISKDHPLTWNPVYSGNTIEYRPKPYLGQSVITTNLNQYNYDFNNSLKLSSLPRASFTQLRTGGFSTMIPSVSSASITREILENQERIKQLVRGTEVRPSSSLYKNSYRESEPYQSLYLSSANNYFRDGSLYQSAFKTQSPSYYLSNDLTNSMTNSITNNMTNSITNNMTNSITNNLSNSLTNNLSNSLTNNLSNSLTNNLTDSLTNEIIINGNNIFSQSITPSTNLNSITSSNANILLALSEQDRLRSVRPTPTLINFSQSLPISKTIK
jgi:serine/threonine protein kinase